MGRTSMPDGQRKPKQSRYYAAEKKRRRQKRNKVLLITVAVFFLCLLVVAVSTGICYMIFQAMKAETQKGNKNPAQTEQTASAVQTVPEEETEQAMPAVQVIPEEGQATSVVQNGSEDDQTMPTAQTGPEDGQTIAAPDGDVQAPDAMETPVLTDTLEGRWSGDGVLIYQFDGNESGLLQSTVGEYTFRYTLKDDRMQVAFQDAPIHDKEFEYSLKDGKLYFKDVATGQSFVFNRIG